MVYDLSNLNTRCLIQKKYEVNIMWIMIILFMAVDIMFVWSLMRVASITDDQSERWAMEHGKDGRNG